MEISAWQTWLAVMIVMAGLELQAPGIVLIFFAIGAALVSAITFIVRVSVPEQILIFIVVSVLSLVFFRNILKKKINVSGEKEQSGLDIQDKINSFAVVHKDIPEIGIGRIKFRGSFWDAKSLDGQSFKKDEQVKIVDVDKDNKACFIVTSTN
ncbi:NfeD family protein [Maridesulfovibrio bastinii]|uniref:NfeD family protein n=1 Tax=Maridesulfovibrio bastinii TaxID=47157 RepID=UPI00041FD6AE|nr:NfeD family protein [Maridesulfovibrio bastinii]